MGKGKSDPGSLIGLLIGLIVLIFGMLDFPCRQDFMIKLKVQIFFKQYCHNHLVILGCKKWGKKIDFTV